MKNSKPNVKAQAHRPKADPKVLGRVIKLLYESYPALVVITAICIVFSAVVSSIPALFLQEVIKIIGDYTVSGDWEAARALITPKIITLVCFYVLSILSMLAYTQLMAYITQGFLSKLRCRMFGGMQDLPIKYFDTHKHGDIMSHYTNDIDALRELVSQSLPQMISSGVIVISVLSIMLYFSLWLTLLVLAGVILMIIISKKVGGGSAKYFIRQQATMGKAEGFIQEMMNGMKVVKVFCHEKKSAEDFDSINNELCNDSRSAHTYASMLGPIIMNIGNILYVLTAIIGGVLILNNVPNVSISMKPLGISILVPFLNMTKQFTGNVNQLSQQVNSVVMAMAGAGRVFSLMDEKPETDDGYVTLVNAKIDSDGNITETDERTGMWAWKHPHGVYLVDIDAVVSYLAVGDIVEAV